MSSQTIWGIHAGKTGDAHSLFLNKNIVAIGWPAMGNLSAIPPNPEAFKAAVTKTYPQHKPGAIPTPFGRTNVNGTRTPSGAWG
jgi:restriction system protein